MAVVEDVDESLRASCVENLVIVNGHGGNYCLRNVVQQATTTRARMALFPATEDWNTARIEAGCKTSAYEDMHGGELEVRAGPGRRGRLSAKFITYVTA